MGQPAAQAPRVCTRCRFYRLRPSPVLFDASDLQSAGALSSQGKWDEEQRQRAKEEMQRVAAGKSFTYEPHHYAWCASFTRAEVVLTIDPEDVDAVTAALNQGIAVLNPVSGELAPVYQLCVVLNPEAACERYERAP